VTGRYPLWRIGAILLATLAVLPYLPVVTGLFFGHGEAWEHVRDTVLLRYVLNTVVLTVSAVVLAVVVGTGGAWILHRYALPMPKLLHVLFVAPLALPVYISTFTWNGILSYGGLLHAATGVTVPFAGMSAAVFVLAMGLYPYVFLTVRAAMMTDTGVLFDAVAALSDPGSRARWGYYRNVMRGVVPTLRPAIAGGAALVAMEVMNAYATPVYLGVETLSTGVFRTWFALGDLPSATRLAAFVLVIVLVLLGVEKAGRGRRRYGGSGAYGTIRHVPISPGRRILLTTLVILPVMLGFGIPLVQLVLWTISSGPGAYVGIGLTAFRTIILALVATVLIVAIAVLVNFSVYLNPGVVVRSVRAVAGIGYAVPGTVIAIGVLVVFRTLRIVDERLFLFGTIAGLLFAYTGRYLAVALQPIRAAFERQHRSTVDAARSLGSSPGRVLWRVVLPVFRPTLAGAALLVAIDVIKDLPMTLLLRPFDFSTLAVEVYRLASDERLPEAAPRALLLVALGILTIIVIMNPGTSSSRKEPR
jgi:iron(III) transport system permease protein